MLVDKMHDPQENIVQILDVPGWRGAHTRKVDVDPLIRLVLGKFGEDGFVFQGFASAREGPAVDEEDGWAGAEGEGVEGWRGGCYCVGLHGGKGCGVGWQLELEVLCNDNSVSFVAQKTSFRYSHACIYT